MKSNTVAGHNWVRSEWETRVNVLVPAQARRTDHSVHAVWSDRPAVNFVGPKCNDDVSVNLLNTSWRLLSVYLTHFVRHGGEEGRQERRTCVVVVTVVNVSLEFCSRSVESTPDVAVDTACLCTSATVPRNTIHQEVLLHFSLHQTTCIHLSRVQTSIVQRSFAFNEPTISHLLCVTIATR